MILPLANHKIVITKHAKSRIEKRHKLNKAYTSGRYHTKDSEYKIRRLLTKFEHHYDYVVVDGIGHLFTAGNYELVIKFEKCQVVVITIIVHESKKAMCTRLHGLKKEGISNE